MEIEKDLIVRRALWYQPFSRDTGDVGRLVPDSRDLLRQTGDNFGEEKPLVFHRTETIQHQ
jgi:hypothetical protein